MIPAPTATKRLLQMFSITLISSGEEIWIPKTF